MRSTTSSTRPKGWSARLEQTFVVIALLLFSRALVVQISWRLAQDPEASGALLNEQHVVVSHPMLLGLYVSIYLITGLLMIRRWREIFAWLGQEKFLLILIILAGVSAGWSLVPGLTLAKSVALAACTLFGIYLAMRFQPEEQMRLLGGAMYLIIIASLLAAMLYPRIGIMEGVHQGLWRGVFIHKNELGKIMPLASIVFFLLAARPAIKGFFWWTGFWLALSLLILSCSKSSLLSYSLLFSAMAAYLALSGKRRLAVTALLSAVLAIGSLGMLSRFDLYPPVMLSKAATAIADRISGQASDQSPGLEGILEQTRSASPPGAENQTGTGRVRLWLTLWDMIRLHPWLGYGFGGFWLGMDGPSAHVWQAVGWYPPTGHNGFIDLWLDLGGVGLLLFSLSASVAGLRALRRLSLNEFDPVALFAPALLAHILLANMGESDLLTVNHIFWICFVCIAMSSHRRIKNP